MLLRTNTTKTEKRTVPPGAVFLFAVLFTILSVSDKFITKGEKTNTSEMHFFKEINMNTYDELQKEMTLTFDAPISFEKKKAPEQATELDDSVLTSEERQAVDNFTKQIDLHNTNGILQYGLGSQKKMAAFSEKALENVSTKDLGPVGEMLENVVVELKSFNALEEKKGFLPFFKRKVNKLSNMKIKYDKVENNVEKICSMLQKHQEQLLKDATMLDRMYEQNLIYFKELSMYILAGRKKLIEVEKNELAQIKERAQMSGKMEDAQMVKDLVGLCERFKKKIHDLELTRMISIQTAAQIRMIQSNDTMMVEKIQTTVVNTVPLWKSQMVLSLGIEHASQAAKAQREVTSMTNNLLKKNAEVLKMASIEAAKESERGVVDIETLQYTNTTLISTLDEVMQIQADGRQKRQEAEEELRRMEIELRDKLLQI